MSKAYEIDQELDSLAVAEGIYERLSESAVQFPSIRHRPCSDCAVTGGMYRDHAETCAKYLLVERRKLVASCWDCHNGGRCEGAAKILVPVTSANNGVSAE